MAQENNGIKVTQLTEVLKVTKSTKVSICVQITSKPQYTKVEEVSMKWMDIPSVTEMERGGVSEMEIANLLYPFL